jgi:hypothetical protein
LRKINYLAIIAGILAVVSLALPWFDGGFKGEIYDMKFTASLYQIAGTVNGVSETVFVSIWFSLVAVAFLVISAVGSFVGSVTLGKKGQLLILTGGILALMSMVVFGAGILNSDFANMHLNPEYTVSYFPDHFGLTTQQINEDWYHYSWSLNVGFWVALAAGIVAFVSLVVHGTKKQALTQQVQAAAAN